MRKLFSLFLIIFLISCSTQARYTNPPENPAPNQTFPGEGYQQTYNPNADAYFLALRGYDINGVPMEGPRDFPSIPLRTLERRHYYRADPNDPSLPEDAQDPGDFFLRNGEYWNGEHWVYPLYPNRRYYPLPYNPWAPRRNQNQQQGEGQQQEEGDRPAGSSFNGGPVHQEQGFQDNHGSTGIPGQPHNNTHR